MEAAAEGTCATGARFSTVQAKCHSTRRNQSHKYCQLEAFRQNLMNSQYVLDELYQSIAKPHSGHVS